MDYFSERKTRPPISQRMVLTRKEEMMTHETNDGGQAFPQLNSTGMTLRDWFAGQALAGNLEMLNSIAEYDAIARMAYDMADRMIEARKE